MLGGSLGLALKRHALADRVVGYVRRAESVDECLKAGAVDEATLDAVAAVSDADLVIFCTPLGQMPTLAGEIAPRLKKGAVATDVGSVKGSIVRDLQAILKPAGVEFVGSHPMAGSEKIGVSSARSDLFQNAVCVVTPTEGNSSEALHAIETLWRGVGASILRLSPEEHDQVVSRSSHLPHVLAAALARYVLDRRQEENQPKLCATGFRDTTRVASGSPEMWRDIVLANRQELRVALQEFVGELREFAALLEQEETAGIEQFFSESKTLRDAWVSRCASSSE